MISVKLLEADLWIEDGSLHNCFDLVLTGFWHFIRTVSLAFDFLALSFLSICLHCSFGLVFLLNNWMSLRAHFGLDWPSVTRWPISLLKFGGKNLFASWLLQKRFLLISISLPLFLRSTGRILDLFALLLLMWGQLANAYVTWTDNLSPWLGLQLGYWFGLHELFAGIAFQSFLASDLLFQILMLVLTIFSLYWLTRC